MQEVFFAERVGTKETWCRKNPSSILFKSLTKKICLRDTRSEFFGSLCAHHFLSTCFLPRKDPISPKLPCAAWGTLLHRFNRKSFNQNMQLNRPFFLKRSICGFMAQIFAFLDPNLGWTHFSQPFLQQNRKPLDRQNVSWLFHKDTDSAHCGNSQAFLLKGKHVVLGSFYSEIPVLRHTIKGSNFMFKILTDVSDVGFVETKWSPVMVL